MNIAKTPEQQSRVEEFQRRHQIRLLTLLFTDLVGSTKLKQLLGERAAIELTERHHALLREILARFSDAEEIDTAGDSFFMAFAKPSDAVQFALVAQRAVRELARETGQPLLDRIGIHVGEVFIQDRGSERRNLFGIQIDATARIMSLGSADQILCSRFAFGNARLVLRGLDIPGIGELSWLNHGYYELKGVEEPLEVCEVGEAGLAALTAPGESEKAHRFHAADAEPVLGWRPAADQLVPETRWKLERPLGQGGFGEVWLAQHETLKQRRVLKFCFKAERARALKREATLFRVLRERFGEHPNIVAIHDVYFEKAPFYLVMDYVDGPSLDRWTGAYATLAEVPLEQRLELVAQIADALQAAHDSGIIHRDVKPSNVLVAGPAEASPRAKLVDFGIGQVVNADALAGVTRLGFTQTMLYTGSGTGTPLYQAPEIIAGQPATTRSDLYSLGVLLWQFVLGDFARPLASDWREQIADPLLAEDIRQCVAGDPAKRFATPADLAVRLRALRERRHAQEEERKQRGEIERRAYRRGIARAAGIAAGIVVVVLGMAVYAFRLAGIAREEKLRANEARESAEAAQQLAEAAQQRAETGEQVAEQAKGRAVAAKKAADDLIGFMQFDLRDTLGKLGHSNMMAGINARVRKYYEEHPAEADDREGLRRRSSALTDQGKLLRTQGDRAGSLKAFLAALAIDEQLVKDEPDDALSQDYLAFSYLDVGDALELLGDSDRAYEVFQKSHALREKFLEKKPNDKTYQWNLGLTHERIGDMLRNRGQLDEALKHFEAQLELIQKIAAIPDPIVGIGVALKKDGESVLVEKLVPGGSAERDGTLQPGDRIEGVAQAGESMVTARGKTVEEVVAMIRGAKDSTVRLSVLSSGASDSKIAKIIDLTRDVVRTGNERAETPRSLSPTYNRLAGIFWAQGDPGKALKTYREGLASAEKLAADDPDNADWKVKLAISHLNIGDLLRAQGDLAGALQSFREVLAIRQRLVLQDPSNTSWQQDLLEIYDRLGNVLKQQGQFGSALEQFRAALVAKVRILGPEHPEILRRRMEIGNALYDAERYADAEEEHRQVTAIRERVLGPDHPDTLESRNNLANALYGEQKFAEAEGVQRALIADRTRVLGAENSETLRTRRNLAGNLTAQGKLGEALAERRTLLAIRKAVADREPENTARKDDLAWCYEDLAGALRAAGNITESLRYFREGLAVREELCAQAPADDGRQRNLSLIWNSVGEALSAQSDRAGALEAYRASLKIMEGLTRKNPDNAGWQNDLAVDLDNVGSTLRDQNDIEGSLANHRQSLNIRKRLAQKDPDNAWWRRDLGVAHCFVGMALQQASKWTEALTEYESYRGLIRQAVTQVPGNANWQRDLALSCNKVGYVLAVQGKPEEALRSYKESMELGTKLAQKDPTSGVWQQDLAFTHESIGGILKTQKDLAGALQSYRSAATIREELQKKDPNNPSTRITLALTLNEIGAILTGQKNWKDAADSFQQVIETVRSQIDEPTSAGMDSVTRFSYAACKLWRILLDAPDETAGISRDDTLRDMKKARDLLRKWKETGKLAPPYGNLAWVEELLDAAE